MLSITSSEFARDSLACESGRVKVWLLTLNHEEFDKPYRFASDGKEVMGFDERTYDPIYKIRSRGNDYIVYPFSLTLPDSQMGNANATAQLRIANASPEISKALQDIVVNIAVISEIVFADTPDTVESRFPDFYLSSVDVTMTSITGQMAYKHFFDEVVPSVTGIQYYFPGLFK